MAPPEAGYGQEREVRPVAVAHGVELAAPDKGQQVVELQYQKAVRPESFDPSAQRQGDVLLVRERVHIDDEVGGLAVRGGQHTLLPKAAEPGPSVMAGELHHRSDSGRRLSRQERGHGGAGVFPARPGLHGERRLRQPRSHGPQLHQGTRVAEP
jgi:hypothetical protein